MTTTPGSHVLGTAPGWANEFEAILDAYRQAGGEPSALQGVEVATLVVSANQVLVAHAVEGISFEAEELPHGVKARISVAPNTHIERTVHLCFGMLPAEGLQEIIADYEIGAGAKVEFLAHCTFPNAMQLEHRMDARIHVGAGAIMKYNEAHFHGPHGGITVKPRAQVTVEEGAQFLTTFSLTHGRAGALDFDYSIDVAARGVAELTTKAYGIAQDAITVRELIRLNGAEARSLAKTRAAVRDEATSQVFTTTEARAPGAKGHMDCTEIVRGSAVARNMPLVVVNDDRAQVTHEAAIGMVNSKELETLMARGLDEDTAVDVIVRGMLR